MVGYTIIQVHPMSHNSKRVEVRDNQGRYGRLDFVRVFKQKELDDIQAWYNNQHQTPPAWLSVAKSLPIGPHNDTLGWWKPCRFQKSSCMVSLDEHVPLDEDGLGWSQMRQLRDHQKELIQWIDEGPVDTEWREQRKYYREQNYDLPTPYEGSTVLNKIEAQGITIEAEKVEEILLVQCHVIYSQQNDAFLTAQHDWKGLNRAVLFTSAEDAETIIKQRKITGAQVASTSLRVDHFQKPEQLGPRAQQAQALRQAEELDKNTEAPAPSRSPRTRL
jgi:hypothetical protein